MKRFIFYGIVIGVFLLLFSCLDIYRIQGESMNKTIKNNSLVILLKKNAFSDYFCKIKRNDAIVFTFLDEKGNQKKLLKNVFGSIGDTCIIETFLNKYKLFIVKNNKNAKQVFLNAESKSFFSKRSQYWFVMKKREEIPLTNHYFVVGTNMNVSFDSRSFGPIPRGSVKGKVLLFFGTSFDEF